VIAVDWGTSNFRAFRLDAMGRIVDRRSSPTGILTVERNGFAELLTSQVGDWLSAGETRILLCGMIGSREGWAETKYINCPVTIEDLAAAVVAIPFGPAKALLIPGVAAKDGSGFPEVMRGEETEAIGAIDAFGGSGTVCLPGTHSKWVQLRDGAMDGFQTCMTGEVYSALRRCTILSSIMSPNATIDESAFLRGVERSSNEGGLLHHLFSVRTLGLVDQLNGETSSSYLSGLLIGHEVRCMMAPSAHVFLVGASDLCHIYSIAITACGGTSTLADEDAAARGLAAIGRRITWS